jgi:hypothetical protein
MPKYFNNECRSSLPTSIRPSVRFFLDYGADWIPIGVNRAIAMQYGERAIPERAGQFMRVATAYIEVDGRIPIALKNLTIAMWKVGSNGYVIQEKRMGRVIDMIDGDNSET